MSEDESTRLVPFRSGESYEERLQRLEMSNRILTDQMAELLVEIRDVGRISDSRLGALEAELASNSETTAEVRDILQVAKAGLKVIGGIGTFVKWVGGLATALAAAWGLYVTARGGVPPK